MPIPGAPFSDVADPRATVAPYANVAAGVYVAHVTMGLVALSIGASALLGDAFPRHIDFMHMPKAVAKIKIYTLAGDLVQELQHDGTSGHGEAKWDLISRNGQEVESGIYLFTVDSPIGHQIGKFVVVR